MDRRAPSAVLWQTWLCVVAGFVCGGMSCKVSASTSNLPGMISGVHNVVCHSATQSDSVHILSAP